MPTINLNQDQFVDYSLTGYLKACGVENFKVSTKIVKVGEEDVIILHIEGYQPSTSKFVNIDMWPRDSATEDDIKALPEKFGDIKFRIGYYIHDDLETGERHITEGKPKWVGYSHPGKGLIEQCVRLSGGKREYQG